MAQADATARKGAAQSGRIKTAQAANNIDVNTGSASRVQAGQQIIGEDGQPFKIVQGKPGNAAWTDVKAVEAALVGQLPPEKAYVPRHLVTPAVAKKALGKKREKIREDVLKPLTVRKDGAPQLAAGSDPREAWTPAAGADEFTTGEDDGTAE